MINKKGFTLAELLIVVVILGVLGSIALPKFYPQKEKAVVAEAVAMLTAIRQGELAYKLETGDFIQMPQYLPDWSVLGIDNPNTGSRFSYAVTVSGADSYATATRIYPSDTKYDGHTLDIVLTSGRWMDPSENTHPFQPTNA